MTVEQALLFRLGELAADHLARPDAYEAQRRLVEAVEAYDLWRFKTAVPEIGIDAATVKDLERAFLGSPDKGSLASRWRRGDETERGTET